MSASDSSSATVLVVDHRHSMSTGWPGETVLDCGRSAALETLADARRRSSPVGLVTVGDDGLTGWEAPAATSSRYGSIDRRLRGLQPTLPGDDEGTPDGGPPAEPDHAAAPTARAAIDRRRAHWALRGDESAFARTVRTFLDAPDDYHRRIGEDQLPEAVRFAARRVPDRYAVVLVTDDSRSDEVRRAVDRAQSSATHVVVHLAARALFLPRDLDDAEETYRGYRAFDRLRQELDSQRHVEVHEVAPV